MQVVNTIKQMKSLRASLKGSVGFVPTMGYLHAGHLSLVKQSKIDNKKTVTSIFVNPTQFGPKEDFKSYPRNTERDLEMLEKEGNDIVFMPLAEEMYPPDFNTWVDVEKLTNYLEGARRPGHFRGVTTVVAKLFNIVEADKAYFGQKDAQQVAVIKKMVEDLNVNLEVVVMPTIREADGLAMSSRNVYLNPEERRSAPILYKSLSLARMLREQGEKDVAAIRAKMTALIKTEPIIEIEYISFANRDTLEEVSSLDRTVLVSLAARLGKTRLIDNLMI